MTNDPKYGGVALGMGTFLRGIVPVAVLFASLLLFNRALTSIVRLALNDEKYSYLLTVPCLSIGLIFLRRRHIFAETEVWPLGAVSAATLSLTSYMLSRHMASINAQWSLSLESLALILFWIAVFAAFFGRLPLKAAVFPLGFLVLFVPLPPSVITVAELALQRASAEVSYMLMRSTGMPVFRDGLKFLLPGIEVEVARECSGIRSSIGLTMASLLLGHLFLDSMWKQACFVGLTIPISIFKNALRIAMLSWLSVYVSRDALMGALHHQGGPLFAMVGLAIQLLLLFALQRLPGRAVS